MLIVFGKETSYFLPEIKFWCKMCKSSIVKKQNPFLFKKGKREKLRRASRQQSKGIEVSQNSLLKEERKLGKKTEATS